MTRRLVASVVLTLVVCFGTFLAVLAAGWTPKRGLDLAGGLSVVYQPVNGQKVSSSTLQTVANIMTARVDALGLTQPNITTQGNNVVVELPGVKDARQILNVIGNTAQLYFRPVLCGAPDFVPPTTKAGEKAPKPVYVTKTTSCPAANQFTAAGYSGTPPNGTYTAPAPYQNLASYSSTPSQADSTRDINVLLPDNSGENYAPRLLLGPALATGEIIKSATAQVNTQGQWVVNASLTGPGTTIFNNIAAKYYKQPLANDLGGTIIDAPVLESTNFDAGLEISGGNGGFTQSQAQNLALVLNYGSIPVRMEPLQIQIVSPTLGAASLRAGLLAGLLGLILVMGYMILYYRALGLVVIIGLLTTGAFIYGLISILGNTSFQLTLDLSGITGLIVSIGITVDSYVVYFERLKDEIRAGKTVRSSADRGFKSAFRTVLYADAVSFLGALVLWLLSIGAVKGFAFYLGLSTLVDVGITFFLTRPLVILLGRSRTVTEAKWIGIARGLARTPVPAEASA